MAVASDEYRLQVMREVAGTRIYDQRKSEAIKMLNESKQRSEKIDDCLKTLEQKINNLENEGQDLQRFLKWDKRRRLLDYIIANKDSENLKNQILKLEAKQMNQNEVMEQKRHKLQELQQKSRVCDKKLKVISAVVKQYRKDMKQINETIDRLNEQKARIESNINDFREKLKYNEENDSKINKELKKVKQEIESKKKRLVFVNAKYEELKKEENDLICNLKAKQSRKTELLSKQNRKDKFRTVEERDLWIESELPKLEKEIESNVKRIGEMKSEVYRLNKQQDLLTNKEQVFFDNILEFVSIYLFF